MPPKGKLPLIDANPAADLKKTDERRFQRTRFLSVEEIDRLLQASSKDFRPILIMALHTGMRRGEIFNLRWQDVSLRHRTLYVRESKSGRPRDIPIDDTLADALKQLPSRFGQGFVFPSPRTGSRLTDVKKQFRKTAKLAGLKDVRLHDARHTFASHLVMNGVDLETVADLLGHSTVRMTERYAHLSPRHRSRAIAVLDSAYRTDTKSDTVEIPATGQSS